MFNEYIIYYNINLNQTNTYQNFEKYTLKLKTGFF